MIRGRKLRYSTAPMLLTILFLAGCRAVSLQAVSPDQISGDNTVALARFECAAPVGEDYFVKPQIPTVPTLEIVLGDSASGGGPRWTESRKDFHLLSKEATTQGWIALIKPPGYYYLSFVGITQGYARNLAGWSPGKRDAPLGHLGRFSDPLGGQPALRIEVPRHAPIVYIGTISIDCPTPDVEASVAIEAKVPLRSIYRPPRSSN